MNMSCVREASPSPPSTESDMSRHEIKRKRFHPLRGLRRIFRRKGRPVIAVSDGNVDAVRRTSKEQYGFRQSVLERDRNDNLALESSRCHSTSHLTDDPDTEQQRRSFHSTVLSVSHDSVFSPEQRSPDSDSESPLFNRRLGFPHSSIKAELFEVVRRRRVCENNGSDDEDLGLPSSPVSNSPTTAEDMFSKGNIVTKSSQSTCSDGSLLSMGSSEMDEDSFIVQSSRNSSKLSLYEKRISLGCEQSPDREKHVKNTSPNKTSAVLCHNAAKHKIAVKPKRTHGVPLRKRQLVTGNSLPSTPEVNEDNTNKHFTKEEKTKEITSRINRNYDYTTVQSKTASLPVGASLTPPSKVKLCRSKSNVMPPGAQQGVTQITSEDVCEEDTDKKEENFFTRLLSRRSGKKKKNHEDSPIMQRKDTDGHTNQSENALHVSCHYIDESIHMKHRNERDPLISSIEHSVDQMEQTFTKDLNIKYEHETTERHSSDNSDYTQNTETISGRVGSSEDSYFEAHKTSSVLQTTCTETKSVMVNKSTEGNRNQPSLRQRLEPLNISADNRTVTDRSFNIQPTKFLLNTSKILNEVNQESSLSAHCVIPLKKSFSFREEQLSSAMDTVLPSAMDATSLPVNVGYHENDQVFKEHSDYLFKPEFENDPVFEEDEILEKEQNLLSKNNSKYEKSENIYGKIVSIKNQQNSSSNSDKTHARPNHIAETDHVNALSDTNILSSPYVSVNCKKTTTDTTESNSNLNISVANYTGMCDNKQAASSTVKHEHVRIRLNSSELKSTDHQWQDTNAGQKESNIVVTSAYRTSSKGQTSVITINSTNHVSTGVSTNSKDVVSSYVENPVLPQSSLEPKPNFSALRSSVKEKSCISTPPNKPQRLAFQGKGKADQRGANNTSAEKINKSNFGFVQKLESSEQNIPDSVGDNRDRDVKVIAESGNTLSQNKTEITTQHVITATNQNMVIVKNQNAGQHIVTPQNTIETVRQENSIDVAELDICDWSKLNVQNRHLSKSTYDQNANSNFSNVILRKKSKDSSSKDEEPELMKVFARRSLKLKDVDIEPLTVEGVIKSRDSDKENEDLDSPPEERKRKDDIVTPLLVETPTMPIHKYQRSISVDSEVNSSPPLFGKNQNEKRQRSKTVPVIDTFEIKQNITNSTKPIEVKDIKDEKVNMESSSNLVTPYKRIQQRREEWEKRAQQGTKVQYH